MKKRSVGRPRDGNPAETRKEILRAAEQSFADSGFVGATTRQVAAKAGVNVATLHYHFGNKEGLYRAVLAEAAAGLVPPHAATPGPPVERLGRFVEALYDFAAARPPLARLATLDMLVGPPSSSSVQGHDEEDARLSALRSLLTSLEGAGARVVRPELAARWILSLIDASVLAVRAGSRSGNGNGSGLDAHGKSVVVAAALRVSGLA